MTLDSKQRALLRELQEISERANNARLALINHTPHMTWLDVDAVVADVRASCDRIDNLMPRTVAGAAQPVEEKS